MKNNLFIKYCVFSKELDLDMYSYGNKSAFEFDQGLKVMLRLNESDDFFYNIPLQGAQVFIKLINYYFLG